MHYLIFSLCICLLSGCVVTRPLPAPATPLNITAYESNWYSWETNLLEVLPSSSLVRHNETTLQVVTLIPDDTKPAITQVVVMVRDYNPEKVSLEDFEVADWQGAAQLSMEEISATETLFTVDLDPTHPEYPQESPFSLFRVTWKALSGQIEYINYQLRDVTYE